MNDDYMCIDFGHQFGNECNRFYSIQIWNLNLLTNENVTLLHLKIKCSCKKKLITWTDFI